MKQAEVLVEVTRGPLVENWHRGHVAVGTGRGSCYSAGDPYHITHWRSSAKPFQALPVVESGAADRFGITPRELALFCASHNGEEMHTETVKGIFAKLGKDPALLQCGVHMPYHAPTAKAMLRAGQEPTPLHCNCSGKHSGMLALCVHLGYDPGTYLEPDHPVQQLILDYIADLTGYPRGEIAIGIDGCGVPVHGLPVYYGLGLCPPGPARRLEPARAEACRRVASAMIAHPEMVGGTDRFCTELMRAGRPTGGQGQAAGVYCVGIMDEGIGIAVKCEDGSGRGRDPAVVEILAQLGYLDSGQLEALAKFHRPQNLNHRKEKCGEVIPVVRLKKEC